MSDPRELFVRLTCELEDLYGLAVEGQSASNDAAHQAVLANEICNGLQRSAGIVEMIVRMVQPS